MSIKNELLSLEARETDLQRHLKAPEMPQLLHPRMVDVYREKVSSLCHALEHEDSRASAADAIRGLIETILLEPEDDRLKITFEGRPAGMLSAARPPSRASENVLRASASLAEACAARCRSRPP